MRLICAVYPAQIESEKKMDKEYIKLLDDLKKEIRDVQNDIVLNANAKLIRLYYRIGKTINDRY